jgi:ribosomal protein S6--L-glutamate ligase
MHIGLLSVRDPGYHPNGRLMEAGHRLGHTVTLVNPITRCPFIRKGRLGLDPPSDDPQIDVLVPRMGATIKEYALTMVRHFECMGIRVVNGFEAIQWARNKFLSLQRLAGEGIPVPDSFHISNPEDLERAVEALGGYPVVLKTLSSRQGSGVTLLDSALTAAFILHNYSEKGQGLMVQEYLPPHDRRDLRAFVLGDQVVAAMELRPKEEDFRANVHLKGTQKPVTLPEALERLAVRAARILGLEIAGADILLDSRGAPKVLELNYSPGFRGLEECTGQDIASAIIRYITQPPSEVSWSSHF